MVTDGESGRPCISNPCAGEIFAATTVQSQGQVSRARYRRLGVECEIVVGLSRDVAPEEVNRRLSQSGSFAGGSQIAARRLIPPAPFTREGMASRVDAVMAGIEIVDDRYRDYRSLGAPTLIADNFFNAGCVLGEPIRDWRRLDLEALGGRMLINGQEVGRGAGGMILGHPFEALAWLANSRASRGLGLQKGAFVFLGSLVETKYPNPGNSVQVEIEGLGALVLEVTA